MQVQYFAVLNYYYLRKLYIDNRTVCILFLFFFLYEMELFFILYSHFDDNAFTHIARFTKLYVILFAHSYNLKIKEHIDKCTPT